MMCRWLRGCRPLNLGPLVFRLDSRDAARQALVALMTNTRIAPVVRQWTYLSWKGLTPWIVRTLTVKRPLKGPALCSPTTPMPQWPQNCQARTLLAETHRLEIFGCTL